MAGPRAQAAVTPSTAPRMDQAVSPADTPVFQLGSGPTITSSIGSLGGKGHLVGAPRFEVGAKASTFPMALHGEAAWKSC